MIDMLRRVIAVPVLEDVVDDATAEALAVFVLNVDDTTFPVKKRRRFHPALTLEVPHVSLQGGEITRGQENDLDLLHGNDHSVAATQSHLMCHLMKLLTKGKSKLIPALESVPLPGLNNEFGRIS